MDTNNASIYKEGDRIKILKSGSYGGVNYTAGEIWTISKTSSGYSHVWASNDKQSTLICVNPNTKYGKEADLITNDLINNSYSIY